MTAGHDLYDSYIVTRAMRKVRAPQGRMLANGQAELDIWHYVLPKPEPTESAAEKKTPTTCGHIRARRKRKAETVV